MSGFKSVIGHEAIIEHLQTAIQLHKVSHAYILNGEDGTGKTVLANAFASALQCEEGGIESCGKCKSCMQAASHNHPDIRYITHEKVSLGVDDIRDQLNNDIYIKPYSSHHKIYIIDEAEKMTEQAQNALLKTLEEPPEYAVILLLTNNTNAFLSTIQSRCVILNLKPLDRSAIKGYLMEQLSIPDYQADLSSEFAYGNLGKAIRYVSSESFSETKAAFLHLVKYLDEMDISEVVQAIKVFVDNKDLIEDYFDLMLLWFRDVLLFKASQDANCLIFANEISDIKRFAGTRTFESIDVTLTAINKAKQRLAANANPELVIELLVLTIKETQL